VGAPADQGQISLGIRRGSGPVVFEEVVDFGGWRRGTDLETDEMVERVERR
jgi:hypothetical protein